MKSRLDPEKKKAIRAQVLDEKVFSKVLDDIFGEIDEDKNGYIDREEMGKLLENLSQALESPTPTEEDITREMKKLDVNKDGKISKEEIRPIVKEIVLLTLDYLGV